MANELTTFDEKWAAQAQEAVTNEPSQSGHWLTTKSGVLSFGDNALPGNQALVIIVDSYRENTFYANDYNPDKAEPPTCFAFGRGGDTMFPHTSMQAHPDVFIPQHVTNDGVVDGCDGCPRAEWGSADKGKGKACQNRRRLICLPAGYYDANGAQLFEDPRHFQTADEAQMKLPVTSGRNWAQYVNLVAATHHRPPHGVITRISVEPHQKWQYQVLFEVVDLVSDKLAEAIMARHASALAKPFPGYEPFEES